jgi:hypothetical protein
MPATVVLVTKAACCCSHYYCYPTDIPTRHYYHHSSKPLHDTDTATLHSCYTCPYYSCLYYSTTAHHQQHHQHRQQDRCHHASSYCRRGLLYSACTGMDRLVALVTQYSQHMGSVRLTTACNHCKCTNSQHHHVCPACSHTHGSTHHLPLHRLLLDR